MSVGDYRGGGGGVCSAMDIRGLGIGTSSLAPPENK